MTAERLGPTTTALGITLLVACAAAALTWVGIHSMVAVAGVAYALAFMALSYRWPIAGLTLIFVLIPFQNDLSGGGAVKFSIAEINLFLFTPVYLWRGWRRRRQLVPLGPLAIPTLLWFGASICSCLFHFRGGVAIVSIVQMVNYLIISIVVFGFAVDDRRQLRTCLYWMVGVGAFLGASAMTHAPGSYVLGMQKNGIGGSLGAAVVICIELWLSEPPGRRRNLLLAALAVIIGGTVFTLSRGAWMGAIIGTGVVLMARGQVVRFLKLSVAIVPLAAICWALLPADKRDYATSFDTGHENIRLRYVSVTYAQNLFRQDPVFGMGVGLRKQYDATNLLLLTMAETGVIGVVTFTLYHGVFFRSVWQARRSVPQSDPRFTFLVLGAALVLAKLMHGMVDHYWGRGALGIAWSAAGMAWGVVIAARAAPAAGFPVVFPAARRSVPQPTGATAVAVAR